MPITPDDTTARAKARLTKIRARQQAHQALRKADHARNVAYLKTAGHTLLHEVYRPVAGGLVHGDHSRVGKP
jgi:hypothetical protein